MIEGYERLVANENNDEDLYDVQQGYIIRLLSDVTVARMEPEAWFIGENELIIRVPTRADVNAVTRYPFSYYRLKFAYEKRLINPFPAQPVDENNGNVVKETHRETRAVMHRTRDGHIDMVRSVRSVTTWEIPVQPDIE